MNCPKQENNKITGQENIKNSNIFGAFWSTYNRPVHGVGTSVEEAAELRDNSAKTFRLKLIPLYLFLDLEEIHRLYFMVYLCLFEIPLIFECYSLRLACFRSFPTTRICAIFRLQPIRARLEPTPTQQNRFPVCINFAATERRPVHERPRESYLITRRRCHFPK